ncbi:MAG TPA: dienelactone hydrolase, partial [Saprospiraceae bacterium]|nr:dienelactone hydrolase [Saprospiraceae bacterium]
MRIKTIYAILLVFSVIFSEKLNSQNSTFVYGDALPDSPIMSARGVYAVGVKTMEFINKNQLDILNTKEGKEMFYDRKLKIEIWYPTDKRDGENPIEKYEEVMGSSNDTKRPIIPFTFLGRAKRDAPIAKSNEKFPLIIVSHGYLGSRYLMTYLTENLASKGYIVVSIDHMESTFRDAGGFTSTLLNRSKDVLFILNQMALINTNDTNYKGRIDVNNTGLIGYSMGGYGVLNVAGAGYSEGSVK